VRAFALLLLLALAPGRAQAQEPPPPVDPRVLPGDLIRLQVWREPDWDGDFLVDQFGVVALPFVGDVPTDGLTQRSLKAKLQEAYAREIANLSLTVLVLKRVRVSGEVRSPGIHPLDPTMRVADALILSGGRTGDGKADEVLLRRAGQTQAVNVLVDARLSELALETGDELIVRQRSWVGRNAMGLLGSGMGLMGLIVALLLR
jgi:polysaccharide biosynthesis/export protein